MAGCCGALRAFLFEYDTPRIVLIRSRKVGLMNRAVQLLILAYVIGWVFLWEKGYQEKDSVVSSVTTKAKGVAQTNTSQLGFRIWDVADYVIPAQEENSLFIMTNMIITVNQTQGTCPEIPDKTTVCESDANCTAGSSGTHSFQDMAVEGGIMGIQVKWDCNLDRAASLCLPRYSFRRLDTRDADHNVSPGYNFRFAKYYRDLAGQEQRTLIKAYGIRFDVIVFGKAGKFDVIPTMINVGSGLALLGVATVLCDIIVLYCMKKRFYYREKKYKFVEDYEQGLAGDTEQ
uniref:Purinergic receptor P2X4 subunit variant 2 n=1 Tax=Cavia porcellus TaxID=10141 RepID=J7IIV9_CAVPO|nr:purinergic receptor P2X4 subunit variant 2 [Cavia porcellus]